MNDIFGKVILCLVYILAVIVCRYVVPWIKNKTGEVAFARLYDYAVLAVRTYNQTMTPEENQQKKARAVIYIQEKAEALGLNMTPGDIDNLIEGIVNEVKEAAKAN